MPLKLWFDVERRYLTTKPALQLLLRLLWFDVERRYLTTSIGSIVTVATLWFDVENNTDIADLFLSDNRKHFIKEFTEYINSIGQIGLAK